MVNDKGKGTVSSSNLSPKHDDAADNSQSETTVSSPMKLNVKVTGVVSESEDKEENTGKGVMNEENAMVVMKNGEIAIEEERNEETAMEEEEKHEENDMEEDEKNEPNALEEEDDYEEENATEEEDEAGEEEEEEEKEEENEEKAIEPAKTEEKIGADSKDNEKRSRKRGRKKQVAQRGSEKVAAKLEDKPGSSGQKKVSKRVESMGMIFMCSSKTKQDCYSYKVLGLPATKRDVVKKVYKGMRLFLFDFDLRLMYGIYKAAGPGGYNIEPKAFKSAFPSQVRFTVLDDCLPLAEEKFRKVIKDNYYSKTKFDCQLNSEQVKNLCKLFVAASRRGSNSKKSGKHLRSETRSFVDRDRIRRHSRDEERRADRDRIRRRSRDEEKRADRDRIRRRSRDEERRSVRRYLDHPIVYERETYASTLAPLPRLQPLHAPPPRPTYDSYGRALEMDVYRREPFVERRDHRYLDLDLDVQYQDEIESRDPYIAYREPPPYRDPDPLYSAAGLPPEYNPPGLRAEYRYPVAPPPSDYGPPRLLYRY